MAQAKTRVPKDPTQTLAKAPRARRVWKTSATGVRGGEAPATTSGGTHATDREQMIRQAAYFRAEQRGFRGGSPEQDWLDAESEIEKILASGGQGSEEKP
ncbi:MAG: DUF2934 domain-containing protein [Proteobacteria bacterium]|nr:DUF2934 domain-containing protein [Pseudomonadota bacterium]